MNRTTKLVVTLAMATVTVGVSRSHIPDADLKRQPKSRPPPFCSGKHAPTVTLLRERRKLVPIWINPDGSGTEVNTPQDVAEALNQDQETADFIAEEMAKEIEEQ